MTNGFEEADSFTDSQKMTSASGREVHARKFYLGFIEHLFLLATTKLSKNPTIRHDVYPHQETDPERFKLTPVVR